jgi:curved DNA-binding protein CbpA
MRSAYLVLGVPGNATDADIETAWERATQLYPPQRIANEPGAVDKFNEIKDAYKVLRDPQAREAHDRKLAAGLRPKPQLRVEVVEEPSPGHRFLMWGLILVGAIFAGGFYMNHRNNEARQAEAAAQLAAQQRAAKEAEEKKQEAEKADAARAAAKARQEADDRRFTYEAQVASNRATMERYRQEQAAAAMQRQAAYEEQRREAQARAEEQRAAYEARMRTEADKRRIRDACYKLYQRYDC